MKTQQDKILISFSGGRSSALMLKILLDNYDKNDLVVIFANTGKERLETLDFVENCSKEFNVEIIWLEAVFDKYKKGVNTQRSCINYKVTDYKKASRDGEPFENLISFLGYLPSRAARLCSSYLKIEIIHKYMKDFYGSDYKTALGIRYDEKRRWRKLKDKDENYTFPLFDMKLTNLDVRNFWTNQSFDLGLKDYQGNCDLCFLKGANKKRTILRESPKLADWWINIEKEKENTFDKNWSVQEILNRSKGKNFKIAKDEFETTQKQLNLDFSCFCGD